MNKQLAVNDAVAGIVAQGGWSTTRSGFCRYRTPNGCKCAIGHLIPDDKYDPDMEGSVANEVVDCISKKYNGVNGGFFEDMQKSLHDKLSKKPFEIKSYTKSVAAFCEEHGLDMPPVLVEQEA